MSLLEKHGIEKDTTVTPLRGKGFWFLMCIRASRWLRPAHMVLQVGSTLVLTSCTMVLPSADTSPVERDLKLSSMGVLDMRAEFRNEFCKRLPSKTSCLDILLHLPGEPPSKTSLVSSVTRKSVKGDTPSMLAQQYRLAFVPGLLAGCMGSSAMPFTDTVDTLRAEGFDARVLSIEGRGTSEHNAELIAQQINDASPDTRPWIVFGYSKGLADVLEALVRHPAITRNIAAVVSYAGAVGGSQLADETNNLSKNLLEYVPLPGCDRGDGSSVHSLSRDVRHTWWQSHHMKLHLPFYSIVAAPRAERVSYPLRSSYAMLSRTDTLNDGQLLATDAVVPGSVLLGYVNADHWAMAMPLSKQIPVAGALFIDDVPRVDLVLASLQVISHHTSKIHE